MNNIDIAKLFLKIIRIKGKISYSNANITIQELVLQYADNKNVIHIMIYSTHFLYMD